MTLIRFDGVWHRYGDRTVLADINVELSESRIGVIGSNGGGKSTLARMINGLALPTQGTVTVGDFATHKHGRQIRQQVGFIFTDPNHQIIMPTVAEDIAFSLRRSGLSKSEQKDRVDAILRRFGLADHADHPTHLLSGGQKQLLALAAVLVTSPRILVADEPTTLLDLRNSHIIAETFAALEQQLVVVTHQLDLLASFDRVLVIESGRIVADGGPAETVAFYKKSAL